MRKIIASLSAVFALLLILTGCSTSSNDESTSDKLVLRMAHGITGSSESGQAIGQIEDIVEAADPNIDVQIYDSGVLGSERDTIELVQAGVLDMAKVGASSLDAFNDLYGVFSLPFMFLDEEDLYSAMTNTDIVDLINEQTYDQGFIMVGWYPSGARNFYTTKSDPILTPEDLEGMKIRVMESATSNQMVSLLGASPVPMSSSETYTALQQGVIEGAENNELALTVNRHMDVAKSYSYTRHQMVPDIYILSTKTLEEMSDEQYDILTNALWENNLYYRELNEQMLNDAREEAEAAGVEFYEVDQEPFKEKILPMHEEYKDKGELYEQIYQEIEDSVGQEVDYGPSENE